MIDLSQLLATQPAAVVRHGPVTFCGVAVNSNEVRSGDLFSPCLADEMGMISSAKHLPLALRAR